MSPAEMNLDPHVLLSLLFLTVFSFVTLIYIFITIPNSVDECGGGGVAPVDVGGAADADVGVGVGVGGSVVGVEVGTAVGVGVGVGVGAVAGVGVGSVAGVGVGAGAGAVVGGGGADADSINDSTAGPSLLVQSLAGYRSANSF
ncbi:uncharacterized protein EV154DRAFT_488660 [Mucor mucedo]|uniref:uncharacterized protein n=1 Tax=Mucor mucedo TaxID=29922 RepID=UPI002220D017|nr:uncharacterized protein EV154DRAFT_488660 [Mucor mucedo]KAI7865821.1 hypothetical protein EV154DRAFT_488660 [Mucor mucedo]